MPTFGHPDYQAFPQWLGAPIAQATGAAIGAGTITQGPFLVANYASVVIAIKANGGKITATLKQTIQGGPAGLVDSVSWTVVNGSTTFETVVLVAQNVELDLQGDTGGMTVDYAIYPANTTTNASVSSVSTVNLSANGALIEADPGVNFNDAAAAAFPGIPGLTWGAVPDPSGTKVSYTPTMTAGPLLVTHDQFVGDVTVAGTTEAGATTVITTTSKTYLNKPVVIKFFSQSFRRSVATAAFNRVLIVLLRDTTVLQGIWANYGVDVSLQGNSGGQFLFARDTPSAAAHTYTVKAYANIANQMVIGAGNGGSGNEAPGFLRVEYEV